MKSKSEIKKIIKELDSYVVGEIAPTLLTKIKILTLLDVIDFDTTKPECLTQKEWEYHTKKEEEGASWEKREKSFTQGE